MSSPSRFPFFSTPNCGPNLQLVFWRACIREFQRLRDIVRSGSDGRFDGDAFAEQAAVVVLLAGAGVACVLGQNDPQPDEKDPSRIRSPKPIAESAGAHHDSHWLGFMDLYDAVRHLGPPKEDVIRKVLLGGDCVQQLQDRLRAAHGVWRSMVAPSKFVDVDGVTNYVFSLQEP
jgi:hypothetical protein